MSLASGYSLHVDPKCKVATNTEICSPFVYLSRLLIENRKKEGNKEFIVQSSAQGMGLKVDGGVVTV